MGLGFGKGERQIKTVFRVGKNVYKKKGKNLVQNEEQNVMDKICHQIYWNRRWASACEWINIFYTCVKIFSHLETHAVTYIFPCSRCRLPFVIFTIRSHIFGFVNGVIFIGCGSFCSDILFVCQITIEDVSIIIQTTSESCLSHVCTGGIQTWKYTNISLMSIF